MVLFVTLGEIHQIKPTPKIIFKKYQNQNTMFNEQFKIKDSQLCTRDNRNKKRKAKFYYDNNSRHLPELEIGEPAIVQINPQSTSNWTKGYVSQKLDDSSYTVNVKGNNYRRSLVNIRQMPTNKETEPENLETS